MNEVLKYDLRLVKWIDTAREISPYAVIPRYPDEVFDVSISKLKSLIKKTKKLAELVNELVKE